MYGPQPLPAQKPLEPSMKSALSSPKPLLAVLAAVLSTFVVLIATGWLIVSLLPAPSHEERATSLLSATPTAWTVPPGPYIDISKQDYEAALAKWQAQGVEEYEITTHLDSFDIANRTVRVG